MGGVVAAMNEDPSFDARGREKVLSVYYSRLTRVNLCPAPSTLYFCTSHRFSDASENAS